MKKFIKFLRKHDAYYKFCYYLNKNGLELMDIQGCIEDNYIYSAFCWEDTELSRNYWSDLNSKWLNKLRNKKLEKKNHKNQSSDLIEDDSKFKKDAFFIYVKGEFIGSTTSNEITIKTNQ
jgi:hypothetical protein